MRNFFGEKNGYILITTRNTRKHLQTSLLQSDKSEDDEATLIIISAHTTRMTLFKSSNHSHSVLDENME
jgi:hypothetical protein